MNDYRAIMIVIITILVSALSRLLPMLLFSKAEKTPEIITYLSKVLPSAIMAFLVIYCLKDTDLFAGNHGIPEALASALVVLRFFAFGVPVSPTLAFTGALLPCA